MNLSQYIKTIQYGITDQNEANSGSNAKAKLKSDILGRVKSKIVENRDLKSKSIPETKRIVLESAMGTIEDVLNEHFKGQVLDSTDKLEIFELLIQNMFGYGVIEPLLKDRSITEIMINGHNDIFIERSGYIEKATNKSGEGVSFTSDEELKSIIEKIVAPINRKVDESDPIVDARLPDGSRVNIVLNPISLDGIAVTIRKFPDQPYSMDELVGFGMLEPQLAELLARMVKAKYNIIVSGGTGSGKTTFLNALSMFIPSDNRIITVEDSAELKLTHIINKVRLETRPPNIEGKGEITMRTLVRSALRMRPDRIVVGEVRGGEALDMLQAMNTGHDGSLTTGHANSAHDMLLRLETMVMMAGMNLPLQAIRQQISSAIDFILHLGRLRDGSRRLLGITEILDMKNGEYEIQDLFTFREESVEKREDNIRINGRLHYNGLQIRNTGKFSSAGIDDYSEFLI